MFTEKLAYRRTALLITCLLFLTTPLLAHTINYAMEKAPSGDVMWYYGRLGFRHIIPEGFDHILFVMGLCLLSNKLKAILWQATAFTFAHSVTLALSMKNIMVAPGEIVEPVIALSILFVAVENLLLAELKPWRIVLVFLFGLVHGMGFASSLNEIGLPLNKFFTSILSFNMGVELGQVAVIAAVFGLFVLPFKKNANYRRRVVYPLSVAIAAISLYWTVERVFFM
ncbi:HupE/UreJ family protein [Foetidibacter luteolus]|uniref:HupE/UreJ family protein n=1 Tax=Foetidibacter luteolus TaxID=2608880 RepID=UPI00129BE958|nr:HupE/UreJ family protein [Foetidibacter luteolus]